MSEDDFLSRWSRRKRAAVRGEEEQPQTVAREGADAPEPVAEVETTSAAAEADETEVDLSDLPSLDSITASTDVTGFLRRGVPEELTRSALRKAWTSDPAIRDFIEIAENQWDFNNPDSIPGFGTIGLTPEQVRQMAAKLVGNVSDAADKIADALESSTDTPQQISQPQIQTGAISADTPAGDAGALSNTDAAAQQAEWAEAEKEQESVPTPAKARRHGGALPH